MINLKNSDTENKKLGILAEDTTLSKISRKVAFTLAEVLIVLGVIGIVAAITLPVLNKKIQQDIWVNQLKKEYATMNQGFKMMLADNNASSLDDTPFVPQQRCTNRDHSSCEQVYNELKKYFKISSIGPIPGGYKYWIYADHDESVKYMENDLFTYNNDVIMFSDGSMFFEYKIESGNSLGLIDVNGLKGPNKPGDDIFSWKLLSDGRFLLYGEKDYSGPGTGGEEQAKRQCLRFCNRFEGCTCGGALKYNNWKRFW